MTAAPDMTAVADMTMNDLTVKKLSCSGVVQCIGGGGSPTSCAGMGTSHAQQLLLAAVGCANMACQSMSSMDGGAKDCTSQTDTSSTCQQCIGTVFQAGLGGSGPCSSQVQACLADM